MKRRDRTCSTTQGKPAASSTFIRIGFVPLTDAAPLIVAAEMGYFAEEGLRVSLKRQIGWGNVRDKLTFGQLDAAHSLIGMPLLSQLGIGTFAEPLVAAMGLGVGSDGITFSRRLVDAGVTTAAALAERIYRHVGEAPVLGHVFGCSAHHYLLRAWLAAGGVDPDRDVRLCVLPPRQVGRQLSRGHVDGYCCGEPYNTQSASDDSGRIVAVTADIVPAHPDKILAVTRRWADDHPDVLRRLCRALLRAMQFCDDDRNLQAVAELIAGPAYLALPIAMTLRSLRLLSTFTGPGVTRAVGSTDWRGRPFDPTSAFPSVTHHAWYGAQMSRWGHLAPAADLSALAAGCVESGPFRSAATSLGIACPDDDAPPMRQRNGTFAIGRPLSAVG